MKDIMNRVRNYLNRRSVRRKIRSGVSIVSCVVIFGTTYMLLMPGIAMEKQADCGIEEHEHTDECYTDVLICGQEESEGHQHSESCYDEAGNLICGLEESEGHQHTEACYEKQLTCGKEVHVHSESCYAQEEQDPEPTAEEVTADEPEQTEAASEDSAEDPGEDREKEQEQDQGSPVEETGQEPADQTAKDSDPAGSQPDPLSDQTGQTQTDLTGEAITDAAAEIEQKDKIAFADFLTDKTTVYHVPENGDKWVPIHSDGDPDPETDVKLIPEQKILLHVAYKLPAGSINATNAETEYALPILLNLTGDEVEKNNTEFYYLINGTDREADELISAGRYEIREERNDEGEVTKRWLVLTFNEESCRKNGGEKLADGTVSLEAQELEGFFEILFSVEDLIGPEKAEPLDYALRTFTVSETEEDAYYECLLKWNDEEELDTPVYLDAAKMDAYLAEKTGSVQEEPVFAAGELVFEGADFTVRAAFDESAKLPEGVTLGVRELEGEEYDAYLEQTQAAMGAEKTVTGGRFFDITFLTAEGKPVEPQGMVDVRIEYAQAQTIEEAASVEGLHFTDEGAEQIEVETETDEKDGAAVNSVSFQSDAFSVYGVVYTQLKKSVISASGEAFEITVTYGEDAGIPDDAELRVREILPEEEEYEEYYRRSFEKIGVTDTDAGRSIVESLVNDLKGNASAYNYAHIFDIQIWSGDQKIEPQSNVNVSIALLDAPAEEDSNLMVVHFGKDGLELMDTANSINAENEAETGKTELNFITNEFSVYSVVNVNSGNIATILGNGPYALVTGIDGDPGATTGYSEDWGTDYFTIIVNGNAMMNQDGVRVVYDEWASSNPTGLGAENVHVWTEADGNYVGGNVTQWGFESTGSGTYRIYAEKNGSKQYIRHSNGTVSLTNAQNSATAFTIIPNSDGTVLIRSGNWYLHNNNAPAGNWNEWVGRNYIMSSHQGGAPSDNTYKFKLCKVSDDFKSSAAKKVASSALVPDDSFLIYRKFVDTNGNESLYALAHDGTFVQVYDGGDYVYWRESDKNLYWNYQLASDGYHIWTTNPGTGERVYISPKYSGTGQTLSGEDKGITLIGRDNGQYGSALESWDQAAYDYAGLHVEMNPTTGAVTLTAGERTDGTSDEFLFAVGRSMPAGQKETVETVDSEALGINITMFDYGDANTEYAAGSKLHSMSTVLDGNGEGNHTFVEAFHPHNATKIAKGYLSNGVPVGLAGEMTGLFTTNGSAVTKSESGVTNLFLKSYYDENGVFRYRSEDNYAYLAPGSKSFTVYRQAATPYTTDKSVGRSYYYHGHFMPFNDIDTSNHISRLMNQYGNAYADGTIVGELPVEDGRSYEDIYGIKGIPNYYTGMKMDANFSQPKDGKLENGDDMIFKFTGDDDMWVYIDDVLVLDIGGIHEPLSGTINFATGKVTNPTGSSLAGEKTLYQIFMAVLNDQSTPQSVKDKINAINWVDADGDHTPDTFADYQNHSFNAFYMERGAGASNLDLQFNLKVVRTDEFTVKKEIPENVDPRFANRMYRYRATYMDQSTRKPLYAGVKDSTEETVCTSVVYKDKVTSSGQPINVNVDEDGYFYLRAGEAAIFKMADENTRYDVWEVDIDGNVIEKVEINGQQASVVDGRAEATFAQVKNRGNVTFKNYPFTQDLLITKHITEDSADDWEADNPVFEFRVYLESTVTDPTTGESVQKLVPYSYGPYYLVKEIDNVRHYYTLTGENNRPEDQGTDPVYCSTTGRSGSINSIPPEYTIIIPDLTVGTNFYLEERRDNIPEGYEFVREELKEGTYDPESMYQGNPDAEVIDRILARDEQDHQEFDPKTIGRIKKGVDAESHVYNRKPKLYTDIVLKKVDKAKFDDEPTDLLRGASFTLTKYTASDFRNKDTSWGDNGSKTLEDKKNQDGTYTLNGTFTFTDVPVGFYMIDEIHLPDGYVQMLGKPTFEVKNQGGSFKVELLDAPEGMVRVIDNTAMIIIANEPGSALPSTGGPGPAMLYMIGALLVTLAAGLLWRRRTLR